MWAECHNGALMAAHPGTYFEDVGAGEPIVLLHAAVADSRQWDPQIAAFSERYRVIRYDMQGFGQTPAAETPVTRADELVQLLDQLSIPRAHIVGVSNGGSTALDAGVAYPARVGALVLVAPGLSGLRMADLGADAASLFEFDAAQEAREEEACAAGDFARAAEISMETWLDGYGRSRASVSPDVVSRVRQITEDTLRRAGDRKPTPQVAPGAASRLSSIAAPTLLLIGEYDLPNVRAMSDFVARNIAGVERVELPNAAHWLNLEHPDRFNALVLEFLAAHPLL